MTPQSHDMFYHKSPVIVISFFDDDDDDGDDDNVLVAGWLGSSGDFLSSWIYYLT